jgi:nucleotide-binding universal stress UspA family protein
MPPIILLPIDGSDKDERALAVAAAFAELANATIRIVRVFESPVQSLSPRASPLGVVDAAHSVRADIVSSLRRSVETLDPGIRRAVTWDVLDGVDVGTTLLDDLAAHEASLVVMATRAAGALGRAIQGSVADRLVRESPCPVVLVPPHARYLGGNRVTIRRVLVPLDGSLPSQQVIPVLQALSQAPLEFVLLQVVRPERVGGHAMPPGTPSLGTPTPDGGEWTHAAAAIAHQRLEGVAEKLRAHGGTAEVSVIESADVGPVVVDAIRNEHVELIAMSTRGESGLRRLVLGSVAEQVVRHSEVPVLLVTPSRSGQMDHPQPPAQSATDKRIDEAGKESFPASDPPPWSRLRPGGPRDLSED